MTEQSAIDRRAQALSEITRMQEDLITANKELSIARREIDRASDRVEMLIEERDRYRSESTTYRTKLVELATAMSNIGLLTVHAQEIMQTVRELTGAETEEQARTERESAAKAIANLPRPLINAEVNGATLR